MRRTLAMFTVLFALLATSCSQLITPGASAPVGNDALIDAMANGIIFEGESVTNDPGEAGCIARAVLGMIGSTRLNEAGVTVESANLLAADLTIDERAAVVGVIADCTDARAAEEGAISDVAAADERASTNTQQVSAASDGAELDSIESNRAELVDLMVSDLLSDPNGPAAGAAEARCMVEGTIDRLGLDGAGIAEMAYSDRDATRQEHNAMVDAFSVCVDVMADFAAGLEDSGFYGTEARCVTNQVGRANIIAMMKTSFDSPDMTSAQALELAGAMEHCGIE